MKPPDTMFQMTESTFIATLEVGFRRYHLNSINSTDGSRINRTDKGKFK